MRAVFAERVLASAKLLRQWMSPCRRFVPSTISRVRDCFVRRVTALLRLQMPILHREQLVQGRPWHERFVTLVLLTVLALPGCSLRRRQPEFEFDPDLAHFHEYASQIEYPDVPSETFDDIAGTPAPLTINSNAAPEFWEMPLSEAIQTALQNSQVMRDLGGLVIQSPNNVKTVQDYAMAVTDPRQGVDAALAAFDASFEASTFFENNDRSLNNVFFGGGTRLLKQDLHAYRFEINKKAATGADFAVRQIIDYDLNNSPGNDNPNRPWTVQVEGEFRQPLMQGSGVDFNRIAGPNAQPGVLNGVLLARINTDVSLADFEISVRNLVNDVETAYWELYFAYRDLDAKVGARDRALETWRRINTLKETNRRGGELEEESQAREQYFRMEEELQNALSGRLQDRIRTLTVRGQGGVQSSERRLRLLMGIAINDGRLIRPSEEPSLAKVLFTWDEILIEALCRREEIRRQKWLVKRRELELVASRNFLLPRLDTVGRYRWRGLGHNLLDDDRQLERFDNAYQDLTSGKFQEWQLGVELTMPIGFRKGHAAVRNAELQLSRERTMLEQTERDIAHDLSAAVAEVERAYLTAQTNYNRRAAAREQLDALGQRFDRSDEGQKIQLLNLLLDAQRRLADSESGYHRALLEHANAIKNVHYQKGSLLDFNEVYLSEGPWPGKAYYDAAQRERGKHPPMPGLNYILRAPYPIGEPFNQRMAPADLTGEPPIPSNEGSVEPTPMPGPPEPLANQTLRPVPAVNVAPVDANDFVTPVSGWMPAEEL
jgi:outer membrane protein TolC